MLVFHLAGNVMLDGGPRAEPEPPLAAWLVTDPRVEFIAQIRRLALLLQDRGWEEDAPVKPRRKCLERVDRTLAERHAAV